MPSAGMSLTEWSDSQQNSRVQTAIPVPPGSKMGFKREIPQPTHLPEPKRKHNIPTPATYSSKTFKPPQTRQAYKEVP